MPAIDGVSETLGPSTIVTGHTPDYKTHCKLEFGTYAQVYQDTDNTMTSRTRGALAMRPMGNDQGGHYFLSLKTGKTTSGYKYTPLPVPDGAIRRVEQLSRKGRAVNSLEFLDRDMNPIGDEPENKIVAMDSNSETDTSDSDYLPSEDESQLTEARRKGQPRNHQEAPTQPCTHQEAPT